MNTATTTEIPIELFAVQTPKGNIYHLIAEGTSKMLCGGRFTFNPHYVYLGSQLLYSSDKANCARCLRAAA